MRRNPDMPEPKNGSQYKVLARCRINKLTIVSLIGDKGSNIQFREASTASSIATLVVRQYAQTSDPALKRKCLDLIDQMEILNYMGMSDELDKIDR